MAGRFWNRPDVTPASESQWVEVAMTILIDKEAFRRFTPKDMHDHLRNFDQLLADLSTKDEYVKTVVANPLAILSIANQFPILHLVALLKDGRWRYFRAAGSLYERRDGHRFVRQNGETAPAGMNPTIRFEVVTDPALTVVCDTKIALKVLFPEGAIEVGEAEDEKARLTELMKDTQKPAVLFSAPWCMLKKGEAQKFQHMRFTLYQHIIGAGHEYPDDGPFYIGITAREWKKRWAEHRAAIMRGSRLKFHRAYGDRLLAKQLTYTHHKVMGVAATLDEIQDFEEAFVAGHWTDTRLLNMIPGGKAGIAYLHEHAMLGRNVIPTPDNVEAALEAWLRDHPRKGIPAPWVSEKWKNDDYALKIICGPEGRLSIDEVLTIRALASGGVSAQQIAESIGARNTEQVLRVIHGKTYQRVKGS